MRFLPMTFALSLALCATLAAHAETIDAFEVHADTITAFNLNATFADGDTMTGIVNIDVTTGTIKTSTLSLLTGATVDSMFTSAGGNENPFGGKFYEEYFSNGTWTFFNMYLPSDSGLVGYAGGSLYSNSNPSPYGVVSGLSTFLSHGSVVKYGTLTIAATPEPSSLALLGTGLLGVAGLVRRRLISAKRNDQA